MSQGASLKVGTKMMWDGNRYTLIGFNGSCVQLRSAAGEHVVVLLATLVAGPGFAVLDDIAERAIEGAAPLLDGLPHDMQARADHLVEHLHEAWTGYRAGNAAMALAGEPRADYDPARTTLSARVAAKAREMGLQERSLWRRRAQYVQDGRWALVDGRRVRSRSPLQRLKPEVRAAIEQELRDQTDESNISAVRLCRLVQARLDHTYGAGVHRAPHRTTFHRILRELARGRGTFGAAKTRRSIANRPDTPYRRFAATRPGEYVLIDCTPLDVYAVDPVSFDWISLVLTIALDLYTRSILAWRFTPREAKDIDAALLLADIIRPKPMRDGWPAAARWRYHGVPEHLVIPAGDARSIAGIPAVYPETIVADHGRIFISRGFQDGCVRLGISIQPTRVFAPTDKAHIERVFRTIRESFLENLPGYKGPSVYARGADVEDDAFYFVNEVETLFAEWVATVYQVRHHDGLSLPVAPGLHVSPNEMYDEGLARAGFVAVPPSPSLYYELLRTEWRTIQHYGVEVGGLRYDGEALNPYRNHSSPYGGMTQGKWPIKYDPRDLSRVYFQEPESHEWATLPWCDAADPARPFTDATLGYAKALLRARGGNAKNHEAIAEVMNALVARMTRDELRGREERKLAAKAFLQLQQMHRDRDETVGSARVATLDVPGPVPEPEAMDLSTVIPMRVARDENDEE
jgi:transposase InsO family protein